MSYQHFSAQEREKIAIGQAQGKNITEIARLLSRHKSSVSREITRNSGKRIYSGVEAQKIYSSRREKCVRPLKYTKSLEDLIFITGLEEGWSPEQTVGRLNPGISVVTIYRWIHKGRFTREASPYLRRKGKKYCYHGTKEKGQITDRVSIDERPKEVVLRQRTGDCECDLIVSGTGKECIFTVVDRYSRFLFSGKLEDKTAIKVAEKMVAALEAYEWHTLTFDNGKEFARHIGIARALGAKSYFAHPYSPWERGTNENTNGLIREYLPKGSSFSDLRQEKLDAIVARLNDRPRKCLGYKTPREVFFANCTRSDACCT